MEKRKDEDTLNLGKLIIAIAIIILLLMAIGTISFHIAEGRGYFDSLYFTVVTFSTIGYGDLFPATNFGKILVMVYSFLGVPLFVALTTLFMERRFRKFIFSHFSHHSRQLAQTEKKLKETERILKDEAMITMEQQQKIKKIEKELKNDGRNTRKNKRKGFFGKILGR